MNRRRDTRTLDLFADWTPPPVTDRPDERVLRARTLRERIALAVAEVLEGQQRSREEIADEMSTYLGGEAVSKAMLDNYASQAKDEHTISFARLVALCAVTGDHRPLQLALDPLDRVSIESRYVGAIQEAMAREQMERLERLARAGRRQWRGAR
ncbi:hypothetical protein MKI84_08375 [Ancylobacter sp. A5.8]|uniref:hypothetical protein n=1 Tax=Ancylobacter gelatini TaxID=2919920 RepID=UPI001F4DA954|nr:hypothetical protein [Ancylobacter gelatini]MCJ8142930.1 hypothetical protein [Ancylobacter gelatini]